MTNEVEFFRATIIALAQDKGFQNEAAQVQAKALLKEIDHGSTQLNWTYNITRVVRNVVAATFELKQLAQSDPNSINDLSDAALKFARVWEALAKLQESTTRETALLNAALNYELAGYQANTACIAKQITLNIHQGESPSLVDMSALFLQRRFIQLHDVAERAQSQPQTDGRVTVPLIESMALALAANAFSAAVSFFLSGDVGSLRRSIEIFANSERLFSTLNSVEETNLVRSVRSLLPVMRDRATWTLLPGLAPDQPRWIRYLKLLSRGVGANIYTGRSVSELWPSQIRAINQGLLHDASNKIVKMPTSAGKTRIAELSIVYTLINNPGAKCIYIAPYRALVSELEQTFLNLLSDLGYRVSSVVGAFESDEFEELLLHDADVVVTTPEKLDLLFRTQPAFFANVQLFVLDEAHIIHDPHRGAKYELLLTRLKRKIPSAKFLILSAVVPDQTLEDFANWLNARQQEDVMSFKWRPSIQRYAMFEWKTHTGVIRYLSEEDILGLRQYVAGVIRHQTFRYTNPKTGRINTKRFPELGNKSQIAAELALKFAELGPVLVFCTQPDFVKAVAKALSSRLEILSLTNQAIPPYFSASNGGRASVLAEDYLGEPYVSWFKSGIGVHYGDLPDPIRNAIETDFRQRKLRVLIATNTLAQGVNLPVKTVIIHSCGRYDEATATRVRIPARDYWNIAGRAGRAGEETEGLIIHIGIGDMDRADVSYYFASRDDVEPVESALYQKLSALVQDRLTEEAFKAEIDPEVLALLVEESAEETPLQVINETLEGSLAWVQAQRSPKQAPFERLQNLFSEVAAGMRERVAPELRAVFSSTGLSTFSCQTIVDHVRSEEQRTRTLFTEEGPNRLDELGEHMLPICMSLPEIQPKREYAGSYIDLLSRWVQGVEIREIIAEFAAEDDSAENLIKFIDDFFRYKLPWGLSGYIRIASHILQIEPATLPNVVKYLPSMVKFGLPVPTACWAMSAGVPTRRVAIEIGSAYSREFPTTFIDELMAIHGEMAPAIHTQRQFLEWLSRLDSERLRFDFGLTPPILDDVRKAILRSGRNPVLREFTDLSSFLPNELEVRGIGYENRDIVAMRTRAGMQAELIRDYDNPVDRNAIRVNVPAGELGYVPSEIAQVLATEMDVGIRLHATVLEVKQSRPPRVSIRIEKN
jgi:helicase